MSRAHRHWKRCSRATLSCVMALCAVACVDPQGKFDEFSVRVIDATESDAFQGTLENVSGRFHLGLDALGQGAVIEFDTQVTLSFVGDGTATISLSAQPLNCRVDQAPCGMPPLASAGAMVATETGTVAADGSFSVEFMAAQVINNNANPLSANDITLESGGMRVGLSGNIVDADTFCGTPVGTANAGGAMVPLNTSTFGARRISDDQVLSDLGPPLLACP